MRRKSKLHKKVLRACADFKRENKDYQVEIKYSGLGLIISAYKGNPDKGVLMGEVRIVETGFLSGGTRVIVNDGHDTFFRDYLIKKSAIPLN